jgi:hypothetical protein
LIPLPDVAFYGFRLRRTHHPTWRTPPHHFHALWGYWRIWNFYPTFCAICLWLRD